MKLLIAKLRRMQFERKSEKWERQIEQLELRLDELEAARAECPVASQRSVVSVPGAKAETKQARRPLPAQLPPEMRKILPKQEACPDCGGELKTLGEDVSEILEYVPEHFKVIRPVRPKLACACCDGEKLHADDTPVPVLAPGNGKTKTGALVDLRPR